MASMRPNAGEEQGEEKQMQMKRAHETERGRDSGNKGEKRRAKEQQTKARKKETDRERQDEEQTQDVCRSGLSTPKTRRGVNVSGLTGSQIHPHASHRPIHSCRNSEPRQGFSETALPSTCSWNPPPMLFQHIHSASGFISIWRPAALWHTVFITTTRKYIC